MNTDNNIPTNFESSISINDENPVPLINSVDDKLKTDEKCTILILNDDCIERFFDCLSAVELSAISNTCKRLQTLATTYFKRIYRNKRTEIAWTYQYKNKIVAAKNYGEFRKVTRNITFIGTANEYRISDPQLDIDVLWYFIYADCNKQPEFLRFEYMNLDQEASGIVRSGLISANTLEFVNCDIKYFYDNFLKHCGNMKKLTVKKCKLNSNNFWLVQSYPLLESLDVHFESLSDHKKLINFFKLNPQVKRFSCRSHLSSKDNSIENVMTAIANNAVKLEEFHLTIGGECNYRNINNQLHEMSLNPEFKRLSLEYANPEVEVIFIDSINILALIDQLDTLYLNGVYFHDVMPTILDPLKNVKEVQLIKIRNHRDLASYIYQIAPNMERFIVRNLQYYSSPIKGFFDFYIKSLPKLNKIVTDTDIWWEIKSSILELNEERSKLKDACPLALWLIPSRNAKEHEKLMKMMPKIEGKMYVHIQQLIHEYEHFQA